MVLRRQPLRDGQDLLVLFTPQGRRDCVARCGRRSGLLEPLTCLRVHLREGKGRSLPHLQEATLDRVFSGLLGDYDRLCWAGYLVHLWLDAFSDPAAGDGNHPYRLLRLSLEGLDMGLEPRWLVSWSELQVMRLLGSAPLLSHCVSCGEESTDGFSVEAGGALCSRCFAPGCIRVGPSVIGWMRRLQRSSLTDLAAQRPAGAESLCLAERVRAYVFANFPRLEKFHP